MGHSATESFAIQPHNVEASRVETLIPEQLRDNASNLISLLTEYYDYMNEDGIVKGINILNPGTGGKIAYADLEQSDEQQGLEVADFVPSNYNQQYARLSEEEINSLSFETIDEVQSIYATVAYRGLVNSNYFVLKLRKVDNNIHVLSNVWVMASVDQGRLKCDFYDSLSDLSLGSVNPAVDQIIFRGNSGGSLLNPDTTTDPAAFQIGQIDPIAVTSSTTTGGVVSETTFVNFTGIPANGGHGTGLTVDILTESGYIVSVIPNTPGHGYRIDDYLELGILKDATLTIGDVIAAPSNVVRRILAEHDIDKTTDDYLGKIQKEIATGIPEATNLDKNSLYKKIVEYYNTRGSESSIESFFKIFFDEVAQVSYPKEFLFKPSDGIYEGSSAVSVTKEKYYYKAGYDENRRIQFLKNDTFGILKEGTFFVDFEFGEDYKKGHTTAASGGGSAGASEGETHLFSAQNWRGTSLTRQQYKDVGVVFEIDANNDLKISGRIGKYQNRFTHTFSNYVTGTNENPFQEPANDNQKRIRVAISIDAKQSYENVWSGANKGRGTVTATVDNSNTMTLDVATDTGTIQAGMYVRQQGAIGLPAANATKVTSYNTTTGALVLTNNVTLSLSQLNLEFYDAHFVLGTTKIGILDNNTADIETATIGSSAQDPNHPNDSSGIQITGTYEVNLYPGAIGSVYHSGSAGALENFEENPFAELYYYGFAFVPRLCTDGEMTNFITGKVIPVDKIVDINFDNSGSVNLTNKGTTVVIAKALTGGGNKVTRTDGSTFIPTVTETNYGLSSTGSEYPRKITWKNTKGFLSDVMKLHDGSYYQEFSYLIRSQLSVDNWETEFNKLVHPAGMKFFTALFLELARERSDYTVPPVLDPTNIKSWLPAVQMLVGIREDEGGRDVSGVHSPKWQPGWFEYFRSVYLEIILYEKYSAFYELQQANLNSKEDIYYDYDNGLKLIGPSTLSGNAKQAIIDSTDDSVSVDEQYIDLDGNATAIDTSGKLRLDSELELTFKLKDTTGSSIKGKYLAGTRFRGMDGSFRELSVKGAAGNKVDVVVSDYDTTTVEGKANDVNNNSKIFEAIRATGTNLNDNDFSQGVEFTDPAVSQETSGNGSGSKGAIFRQYGRGHNLIIFNPNSGSITADGDSYAHNKYRYFHYDTYNGSVSGHVASGGVSARGVAEHALHDKLESMPAGLIAIIYTQDAAGCHMNVLNRIGPGSNGHYTIGSSNGYDRDGQADIQGLRYALAKYFGATDAQTQFGNINSAVGSTDLLDDNSTHRTSHVFIGERNSVAQADATYTINSDRSIEKCSVRTGDDSSRSVTLQYQSQTHTKTTAGQSVSNSITRRGPFERDKLLQLADAEKGLNLAQPYTVDLGTPGSFRTLNVNVNGQIKLDDTILRSEKEASSPQIVDEILLEKYDYTAALVPHGQRNETGNSNQTIIDNNEWHTQTHINRNNTMGLYYDYDLEGVVSQGGNQWLAVKNDSIIDNEDTEFEITVEVKNIASHSNRYYIGHESLDAGGNAVRTDRFNTDNWAGRSGELLTVGAEQTTTYKVKGFNPVLAEQANQGVAHPDTSVFKFDPGAKKFRLVIISNYSSTNTFNTGNNLGNDANTPSLLIKKISIKRTDGKAIEFAGLPKGSADWGIKNISSLSLPPITINADATNNNLEESNVSIGSINIDKQIAGLHSGDTSFTDTNLYKDYLPWTPGSGQKTINGGRWGTNGASFESTQTITDGPFGTPAVTWTATNQDTSSSGEGGYNGPTVAVDPTKDHRLSTYFRMPQKGASNANGKMYFGIREAHAPGTTNAFGGGTNAGRDKITGILSTILAGENGTSKAITRVDLGAETFIYTDSDFINSARPAVKFESFSSADTSQGVLANNLNIGTHNKILYAAKLGEVDGKFKVKLYNDDLFQSPVISNNGVTETVTNFTLTPVVRRISTSNYYSFTPRINDFKGVENRWYVVNTLIKAHQGHEGQSQASTKVPEWVGCFDLVTGEKIYSSGTVSSSAVRTAMFSSINAKRLQTRAYQFYNSTEETDAIEFGEPMLEVLDGTEVPYKDLLSLPRHKVSQYPAGIQLSKAALISSDKTSDFKLNISEFDRAAFKSGVNTSTEVQAITSVPSTGTSSAEILLAPTDVTNALTLTNIINPSNTTTEVLLGAGIRNLSGVTYKNAAYSNAPVGKSFNIFSSDYTSSPAGSGATFVAMVKEDVTATTPAEQYYIELTIKESGYLWQEGSTITISDSKVGNTGAPDLVYKVEKIHHGKVDIPNTHLISSADGKVTLALDETISTDSSEIFDTHNILFNKNKEYEVSFDATQLFDYNLPSNLYISGGNQIGYYTNLTGLGGPSNAFGNPHIGSAINQGDGPHEFNWHSTTEGFCRIFLAISNADSGIRLAHNGHELRIVDTNTTSISSTAEPKNWYISDSSLSHHNTVTSLQNESSSADGRAKSSQDTDAFENSADNPNPALGNSILVVFESEWLSYGDNTIQIYNTKNDDVTFKFLEVAPAAQGLITSGSNSHTIYMDSDTVSPKIIIDHKIDRLASRLNDSTANGRAIANYEKQYAYAYKLENIKVREKRRLLYKGEFKSIVADAPAAETGATNSNSLYGTPSYRQLDVSSATATDGVLAQGGTIRVPSVDAYDSASGLGGRSDGTNLTLGIPKGNYGALKFEAGDQSVHYLDIGSDTNRFPYDEDNGISTWKPNEIYEISGEVFIPSTNTKLEKIMILAGVNPRALNDQGQYQFGNNESPYHNTTYPLFKNRLGQYQIREGAMAGYNYLSNQETTITTKGSWVSFKHTFTTRGLAEETRPVIRIASNVKGEAVGNVEAYAGTAVGESFYVKRIRIKEGFNTDLIQDKKAITDRRTAFVNAKAQRNYSLSLQAPAGGVIEEEALIFSKIKYPTASNQYKIRINDTAPLVSTEFNLEDLPTNDSNLLASALPFPINSTTNTASYGRADINIHGGNTPNDLINCPSGFIPLGNPIQIGLGTDNTPYTNTYENTAKVVATPFGNRDVIWEARNTDDEWKEVTKVNKTVNPTAIAQGTYTNVPLIDANSPSASSHNKNLAIGKGATINFTVGTSNNIFNVSLQNKGFNYGVNHNSSFGIPVKFALGAAHVAANGGNRTTDVGDSPEKLTAPTNEIYNIESFAGKTKVTGSSASTTNYSIGNSPSTSYGAIEPGMIVTGTGISGTVTVASVNYSGTLGHTFTAKKQPIPIVLSSAQTINDNVSLTFRKPTRSITVGARTPNGADDGIVKVGMQVSGGSIPAGTTVSSIAHQSPNQTRVTITDNTVNITNPTTLTFQDPFYSIKDAVGYVFKANIQSSSGSDSPLQNKTDFSYDDGGFKSPIVEIDNSKLYRVSIWAKAADTTFTNDSPKTQGYTTSMGSMKTIAWAGSSDAALATPLESNNGNNTARQRCTFFKDFDFGAHSATSVATSTGGNNDKWFLVVAHIHPAGTNPGGFNNHTTTGIYAPDLNGTKIRSITNTKHGDWIFSPGMKYIQIEAINNGNIRTTEDPVQFYAPRIEIVDGTEASISELTSGKIRYKNLANEDRKEIPILSWNHTLSNINKPIKDYKHIIEQEKFNVKIDEDFVVNGEAIEYADMIEQKIVPVKGTTESVFTLDFTGKTGDVSIILPLQNVGSGMNASVDWGDGTSHIIRYTADKDLYHTYTNGGGKGYNIRIDGQFDKIQSDGNTTSGSTATASTSNKTIARSNWKTSLISAYLGNSSLKADGLLQGFKNCTALKSFITNSGTTNTSAITQLTSTFEGCSSLETIDMSGMDTSNVTALQDFHKASSAKTVNVIGLHSRNWDALTVGTGNGFSGAFTNVDIGTAELDRCYIAWANNRFANTTKGRSHGSATDAQKFNADMGTAKYSLIGKRTSATDTSEDSASTYNPVAARTILVSDTSGSSSSPNMGWTLTDGGQAT